MFAVDDDSLTVDNDAQFSACDDPEGRDCSQPVHRCDFHRFRSIASGNKREQAGTIGAFGIGFTAVYQITDYPELISVGRHWTLREDAPDDRRIEVCGGCERCRAEILPGTRFVLPWARDATSRVRQGLRAEPVGPNAANELRGNLLTSASAAILFLRHVSAVRVAAVGLDEHLIRKRSTDSGVSIEVDDGTAQSWLLLQGDFDHEATTLREQHPQIEAKRVSTISVAVPLGRDVAGLLYAYLPTEHSTGLPFHVQADFFPSSDRKRVIFGADFQSEWNAAIMRQSAKLLAREVLKVRDATSPSDFWRLVSEVWSTDKSDEHPEVRSAEFWNEAADALRRAESIQTTSGRWERPSDCLILQTEEEEAGGLSALEAIGLSIVPPGLRPFRSVLTELGAEVFTLPHLVTVLEELQRTSSQPDSLIPNAWHDCVRPLWGQLALLLERRRSQAKEQVKSEIERLRRLPIVPVRTGNLAAPDKVMRADERTMELFERPGIEIPFLAAENELPDTLRLLCSDFDASAAVGVLRTCLSAASPGWRADRLPLTALFAWFEARRSDIVDVPQVKQDLLRLPLFPTTGGLRAGTEVFLPSDFVDELGIADVIDVQQLGQRREFLRDIGIPELNFPSYATRFIPRALGTASAEQRRGIVRLLGERLGTLSGDEDARATLRPLPLVECIGETFGAADDCYFDEPSVRECLPDAQRAIAAGPATESLHEWLGVSRRPRVVDILARIRTLVSAPPISANVERMATLFAHISEDFRNGQDKGLEPLRTLPWLPARGDSETWYAPDALHAVFEEYLFASQARFLAWKLPLQKESTSFLRFLGVGISPTPALVVRDLLSRQSKGLPANSEVYRFLNGHVTDPSLDELKGKAVLYIDGEYRSAREVFWDEHRLVPYRHVLTQDLAAFRPLLERLGVRRVPTAPDARDVIRQIAAKYGDDTVDSDALVVVAECWRMLDQRVDEEGAADVIRAMWECCCIPRPKDHRLGLPIDLFFDDRPDLCRKFPSLDSRLVPRRLEAERAYALAGVQPFSRQVRTELLEARDAVASSELDELLAGRHNAISRVLAADLPPVDVRAALGRLAEIRCYHVEALTVRYRFNVGAKKTIFSTPERPGAVYDAERLRLLHDGRATVTLALARELASALVPDREPGKTAAALKEVLQADDADDAGRALDDLGFARVDESDTSLAPRVQSTLSQLGAIGDQEPDTTSRDAPRVSGQGPVLEVTNYQSVPSDHRLVDGAVPLPTRPLIDDAPSKATLGTASDGLPSPTTSSRAVLRSYLPAPRSREALPSTPSATREVDEAGIRRVLEFEERSAREAREMSHSNPGYDIESVDRFGVVRFIEVKSLAGWWHDSWAQLSRAQFLFQPAESFWLYVVERATSDDYRIHPILNPGQHANTFMFDDGWSELARFDDP